MSDTLNNLVPELTMAKTNELIKEAVSRMVNDVVKQDRESSTAINIFLNVHPTTIDDPVLWDVLKRKFEKSSALISSCRDDVFCKRDHDEYQGDDGPPEG
ncbi:hypothetical protein Tco_1134399 [Tanacetum coccineum]